MRFTVSSHLLAVFMLRLRRFLDLEQQLTSDTFGYYKIPEVLQEPQIYTKFEAKQKIIWIVIYVTLQ